MIVNRQREIENFVPKQSWVLSTIYRNTKFNAIAHDEEAEAEDAAEVEKARKEGKTIKSKGDIYKPLEFLTKEEGEKVVEEIKDQPLRVVSVTKKKGTEKPPQLFDLTTLQVECNKKFAYTAEQTLNLIQSLYEKKFTTYPRVDTQYLTDDIYKKCPQTLNGVYQVKFNGTAPYADLIRPLGGGKALRKDKKVFDNSKVTDHHAIIPTGVIPKGLSDAERNVYDLIARRFIAVFYDDCKFETTTVMAEVKPTPEDASPILFRTSGKVITDEGWKVVFKKETQAQAENADGENGEAATDNSGDEKLLPTFNKGEEGPHEPQLAEKWTSPPPYYTEATLLRAMETAGKFVDNDELRAAMKENGIGRPSSRANIIETLFKRQYIKRERKRIVATPTGKALIDVIHEELLKSPELTGIWEKKLRDIEARKYDAATFINELKQQITDIVNQVLSDNSNRKLL
jgi:DNA topoisomerase-3